MARKKSTRRRFHLRLRPSDAVRWIKPVCLVLLCLVAAAASLEIRERVSKEERFYLDSWQIEASTLPEWITPEIRDELLAVDLGEAAGRLSLLAPGVLNRLQAALEAISWVQRVELTGLSYPSGDLPGSLGLEYRLRRPVAIVEHGQLYYLSSREGLRLGKPYATPPSEWFGVPTIVGLFDPGPLPEEGERWASRDVQQGIEVARALMEHHIHRDFPHQPIETIDLRNLHGRWSPAESEIVLWCGNKRLTWGRSPISTGPRTAPVPQLIANLRFVLSHPERFQGLALIHLHRDRVMMTGVRS